jgi:hypothetical protein
MIDDFKSNDKQSSDSLSDDKKDNLAKSPKSDKKFQGLDADEDASETSSPKPDFIIDESLTDDPDQDDDSQTGVDNKKSDKPKGSLTQIMRFKRPLGKKEKLAITLMLLLIIGVVYLLVSDKNQTIKSASVIKATNVAPVSTLVPSTLSGLPVPPSVNKIPVTGVMIENSDFARPQAGLSQASVVFEAIAEDGITRFLALFQDTSPSNVGPIRSVRPYYEQWALGFDASIAHVGGSPEALADIKTWNVKNLDEFYNGDSYHRISTRQAPHNVYTSISDLNQLEANKGYTSTNFSGFPRKAAAPSKSPDAATIDFNISSSDFAVKYVYNAATNSYNRFLAGVPHIDANTNKQISPTVVIGMIIPYSIESDGYHSAYGVIGSGKVYVFQDGNVTTGTWTKTSSTSQIKFTSNNGQTIKLDPGQTWITALGTSSDVSY